MSVVELTLAERASLMRAWEREEQMRDRSYLTGTSFGAHIGRYLDYKRWRGLEDGTLENREVPLRMLRNEWFCPSPELDAVIEAARLEREAEREQRLRDYHGRYSHPGVIGGAGAGA